MSELKGKWATVTTNTGLPLNGKVSTVLAYLAKYGYTIGEVYYDGTDCFASIRAFDKVSGGKLFVIA